MNGQILEREIRTPLQIAEEVFPLTEGLLPQLHMDRLDQVLTRGPHSDVERVSLQPIDRKAVDETGLENERERARPAGFREKGFVERRHAITRRALVAFPKPGGIGCARLVGGCRRTRHSPPPPVGFPPPTSADADSGIHPAGPGLLAHDRVHFRDGSAGAEHLGHDGFWQKNVHAVTFPAAGALTRRRWPPPLTWSNCSTSCGAPAVFRAVWADDCRSSDSSARMALISASSACVSSSLPGPVAAYTPSLPPTLAKGRMPSGPASPIRPMSKTVGRDTTPLEKAAPVANTGPFQSSPRISLCQYTSSGVKCATLPSG